LLVRPKDTIEILSFEATLTSLIARDVVKVAELAYRLRIMGSLALSLCHLAAGRVDAVCSLKSARSVDIGAAQLLVVELSHDRSAGQRAAVRRRRARPRRAVARRGRGDGGALRPGGRCVAAGLSRASSCK
jgi:fructose-1,6-bisphosphatase/inositol monophosphatase family enzyme